MTAALPATVPSPTPPDDPDAWYAPDVRAQYEVHPGVVVTVSEAAQGFDYEVREPHLPAADAAALEDVREHFAAARLSRPLTREGTAARAAAGLDPKHRRIVGRLADRSAPGRRRVEYYALRDLQCLGDLTPLALDADIEVADVASDNLVVHTVDYAPAETDLPAEPEHLDRFMNERLEAYTVPFQGFEVPVVLYRERLLGTDAFTVKYAVQEPDRLPGDDALLEACKEQVWDANVDDLVDDRASFVRERATRFLSRRLTARNTRAWLDAARHRVRTALADRGLAVPPLDRRFSADRLEDLVYYVLRDFVGHGELTVPIRDPHLEDIEANRVGERVKVVPRDDAVGGVGRIPTNLAFDDERQFVNLVTHLAAADGVELSTSRPSAKVNLDPEEVPAGTTIRCAVALPVISEDGPHVSIRKQAADALTPVDLVAAGSVSTEMVALLWLCYEHHGVVLFSGPTGVGKTTLMNAHMPFIPFDDRPISIDEGFREVQFPHETGVSLTTRDHETEYKRVTMADLMVECNYLNPDVEVIGEINTRASFESFAATLNTGHGVLGTTHAESVTALANRAVEQGLPAYLLADVDLVVFPRRVDGDRYVGEVVEFLTEAEYDDLAAGTGGGDRGVVEADGARVHWHRVAAREGDGTFTYAGEDGDVRVFDRLAARTDRPVHEVAAEFERKHRYVQYMVREGVTDAEALFAFLSDLRTNEAATVERIGRTRADE